jgi:hypothetical protein
MVPARTGHTHLGADPKPTNRRSTRRPAREKTKCARLCVVGSTTLRNSLALMSDLPQDDLRTLAREERPAPCGVCRALGSGNGMHSESALEDRAASVSFPNVMKRTELRKHAVALVRFQEFVVCEVRQKSEEAALILSQIGCFAIEINF